jgi:hypothetical protein
VTLEPVGLTEAALARLQAQLLTGAAVRRALGTAKYRLLATRALDEETDAKPRRAADPGRFRATIYDYTGDRTLFVDGRVDDPRRATVTESAVQPLPSEEEFAAAVALLRRDAAVGPLVGEGRLQPYLAMPPLVGEELPDGRTRRVLAVGLLPRDRADARAHEIVGVSLGRREVAHFDRRAPDRAVVTLGANGICGVPNAFQPTTNSAAGSAQVTVKRGSTVLWRFRAVRPAASSGTNGSGVELRFVDYRGRRVLYRAHVPFLNVKYDNDACGPYRDWQNEEGMLQASGTNVAPGFLLCPTPATTVLQTGDDTGTFLGTAIYVDGQEVVLVCEMQAGWYRYVSEWRLHANGTIRPRFGFGAVSSSCVCNRHHHHVYWRLDFDIGTATGNRVREFNDPPLAGGSKWHDKLYEIARPRDPARKRRWRVVNVATGKGYDVTPGPDDGVASGMPDAPFGRGDVWITRYRASEIDDGVVAVGPPYEADIGAWVNGEPIGNADVVVWYAAHFTHDVVGEGGGGHGHVVGPNLVPVSW